MTRFGLKCRCSRRAAQTPDAESKDWEAPLAAERQEVRQLGVQRMKIFHFALLAISCVVLARVECDGAGTSAREQAQQLVPRAVLKLIVDHSALAPYLHPEVAGRIPVVISDHLLEPGVTPSKFGKPLRIVPDREVGAQPHLRVLTFKVDGPVAKLTLEYKVEGVEAVFTLRRDSNGWWSVVEAKVVVGRCLTTG